ncbi:gluconolaconase [Streptomyces sp. NPDC004542]|uniref:gluconolaconase n=1 Tax=Streptomyces sp. NPDC004542 TaxID=3154281 RepID=UPI0033BBDAE6
MSDTPFGEVITGHADALHPEGVDWDPNRQAFLVSSTRHGTASIVDGHGTVTPLVTDPDPRIVSTVGITVDVPRNRLLLGYHDLGIGARSTPETNLKESGIAVYDLTTGEEQFLVDLALGPERMHAADRIALAEDGTAYVSDPAANKVYRVDVDGKAEVLADSQAISPGWELGTGAGVIGIRVHPAGFLLTLQYSTGALARIDVETGEVHQVRLESGPIIGGDAFALRADGTVVVVSNKLANENGTDAVHVLSPVDDTWSAARTVHHQPWPEANPTDVLPTPHGDYVLSGRPEYLFRGETADDFVLRRI